MIVSYRHMYARPNLERKRIWSEVACIGDGTGTLLAYYPPQTRPESPSSHGWSRSRFCDDDSGTATRMWNTVQGTPEWSGVSEARLTG